MYVSFILFIYFDLYSLFLSLQIVKAFRLRESYDLCVAASFLLTAVCEDIIVVTGDLSTFLQQPATCQMTKPATYRISCITFII